MAQRLLTPSKITAWLDCEHYLALRHEVETGQRAEPNPEYGSFARLLRDKGQQHETDCLADYRRDGKTVFAVPPRDNGETFEHWVTRVGNPLDGSHDVIYQMPFIHDGTRGVADFVVKVLHPHTGAVSYEPVDAKLARAEAKPGHVLQLCFYADAIEALTGTRPHRMQLWLGSGEIESLIVEEYAPYWRRLRGQLTAALAVGPPSGTVPEPCAHCDFCEFRHVCTTRWRDEDSLIYIAGIRAPERAVLAEHGVTTLAGLAKTAGEIDGLRPERSIRLIEQAALQVQARQDCAGPVPFRLIEPLDAERGLPALPQPDDGEVFIDFEGHPFWRIDTGLFFLFGCLERGTDGHWHYRSWWAHDTAGEATAVAALIDFLTARRVTHPGAHAYHYNHTERSALQRLTAMHGVRVAELGELIATGFFIDLYPVACNAVQAGVESYGLKSLERLTDFQRGHDIDQGASAVIEYERYMTSSDAAALQRIAAYNEDDVRATLALRDWLITQRPGDLAWRAAELEQQEDERELDERIDRLHAFAPDTPEHLLGDLLGYWGREWLAYAAPKRVKCQGDPTTLFDDDEALAGLCPGELTPPIGRQKKPRLQLTFPPQPAGKFPAEGGNVLYVTADEKTQFAGVDALDAQAGQITLAWDDEKAEVPDVVIVDDWVSAKYKRLALSEFASELLDGAAPNPVTVALLRREKPKFRAGGGPAGGEFNDDLADMIGWVTELDHSYVAVQGPPGTGKSYSAAHLVHALIKAGRRVGITAMSHAAIDNLLGKILEVFDNAGDRDLLRAVRKPKSDTDPVPDGVTRATKNPQCAKRDYNLIAGSAWLFSSAAMRALPVDVLLVDEAGQLGLADTLAASLGADNLILLGDPQQLPQVTQADHPNGSDRSALEHILDTAVTIPAERGVFLSQTWRMHDDVCTFISKAFYDGRLTSESACNVQTTQHGTGLRWLQAHHQDRSTESIEEAELIAAELTRLIGIDWTDRERDTKPLTAGDIMVVAAYNDQVRTIGERLAQEPALAGVPIGTVDRFQGQEAAVVFFSMATSTGADMTRGADFLFSRKRLNVAISRARCLAYLVCTGELLNARARSVEDMRLIATLNAFVEVVEDQARRSVITGRDASMLP